MSLDVTASRIDPGAMKAEDCRGCRSRNLATLHDFGAQPLAGNYPLVPERVRPVSRYPLDLTRCLDCGLLQVVNLPPIDAVFHADYRYSSSTVPGLVNHFVQYANWLKRYLGDGAQVFEFGCNDGVLLERLEAPGITCAGIDASDNVASIARNKGLQVATGFLTENYVQAAGLEERYDLVTCSNVLAHIHDLGDVSNAVRRLLKPEGLFVVEVHDGELLERQNQFDTIYHEHLTYFTEETLRGFLERRGFRFVLCERTSMHGGALRCLVRKASSSDPVTTNSVGRTVRAASADFIGPMIEKCRLELERLYEANGPLAGYGAAGRSQMFINFTKSGRLFDRVYDDSPFRQRRFIAGTDIPISKFEGESGDCCIILAWNYADDIHRKIRNQYETVVTMLPAFRVW